MGATESVPREQQAVIIRKDRSSRPLDMGAMQEKLDSFKVTEDEQSGSMIVDRQTGMPMLLPFF